MDLLVALHFSCFERNTSALSCVPEIYPANVSHCDVPFLRRDRFDEIYADPTQDFYSLEWNLLAAQPKLFTCATFVHLPFLSGIIIGTI